MADNEKKKGGSGFGFVAVAGIGAVILSQMGCEGFSIGTGMDGITGTEQSISDTTYPTDDSKIIATQPQATIVEITIDGSEYIINGKRMNIYDLMIEVNNNEKSAEIRITCADTATLNAQNDLIDRLKASGYDNYTLMN